MAARLRDPRRCCRSVPRPPGAPLSGWDRGPCPAKRCGGRGSRRGASTPPFPWGLPLRRRSAPLKLTARSSRIPHPQKRAFFFFCSLPPSLSSPPSPRYLALAVRPRAPFVTLPSSPLSHRRLPQDLCWWLGLTLGWRRSGKERCRSPGCCSFILSPPPCPPPPPPPPRRCGGSGAA